MTPSYLWAFNQSANAGGTTGDTTALPDLLPIGSKTDKPSSGISTKNQRKSSTATRLINVVKDYYWTYSPVGNTARAEVPRIILTERKLLSNALISQLKYSLGQLSSGGKQTLQNIQQFGASTGLTNAAADSSLTKFIAGLVQSAENGATTLDNATGNVTSSTIGGLSQAAGDAGGQVANSQVGQATQAAYAQVKTAVTTALQDDDNSTVNSSPWLAPYRNLYQTTPTGWVYVLPYFTNNQASQGNTFSDDGSTGSPAVQGLIKDAGAAITGLAGIAASLNNPTQITYIEKTKFYNYPTEGEEITVEFPLINTGNVTFDDVTKNWQFLFLLLYQNRPGKTSQNTVDQPVIYQVEVPGVKFFPFCYIQSLNIEFMGSRRELTIKVPTVSQTVSNSGPVNQLANGALKPTENFIDSQSTIGYQQILAVIPDAYKVSITLKSMIANSKNFMQHMISNQNIVETSTSSSIVNTLVTPNNDSLGANV